MFKAWNGILIEPIYSQFIKCKKARSGITVNCACSAFSYKNDTVQMIYSNLMTTNKVPTKEMTDPIYHTHAGAKIQGIKTYEFTVESKPLNQILDENNAPTLIDFLNIDVEGSEISVLEGIDFAKYGFDWILIETSDFTKVRKNLKQFGYKYIVKLSHHDYLFSGSRI